MTENMSWRPYEDSFLKKETYTYVCKNNLIEWNQDLHILVNPSSGKTKAKILFTKNELINYCLKCGKRDVCDQKTRDELLKIVWEQDANVKNTNKIRENHLAY